MLELSYPLPTTQLRSLYLVNTGVTDKGLAELAKLPALESLGLDGNEITARGLVHILAMKNLNISLWTSLPNPSRRRCRTPAGVAKSGDCPWDLIPQPYGRGEVANREIPRGEVAIASYSHCH